MGRQMKVALELQPCCRQQTGIGTYTYELARRLTNQGGLEFCGNLFNFASRTGSRAAMRDISMPVRECRELSYGLYRRIWHLCPISYDSLFPGGADLTVFFDYIVPPRISGKVITTIHDMTYVRYPEMMNQKNLRRIRRDFEYSLERSARILTVSEFSKREIMELLHIPAEKISVVYNAPALREEAADFETVAEKYQIDDPYILYVGTIEPRKNLMRLLKAFRLMKKEQGIEHKLVLAGGSGWRNKEVYQMAESLPCAQDVIFTGYVSEGEKSALYRHAAVFAFPTLYEGFGIPVLEAQSCGVPVLTSDCASLPEVGGEGALYVNPYDEKAIAQGLWKLLTDRELAEKLVRAGYENRKRFSWERSAERLCEIIEKEVGHGMEETIPPVDGENL